MSGFLLKGYGYRYDSAVELGQGYAHGSVYGTQSQGAFLPILFSAGADDSLDDWNVQLVKVVHRPSGGDGRSLGAQLTHGHPHGRDDAIDLGNTVGIGQVLGKGTVALAVLFRIVLQTVGEQGQDVGAQRFQPVNQTIDRKQVSAHPVRPVKKKGDTGLSSLEPVPDVIIDLGPLGHIGVVQALPRNVAGRFVSIIGTQVGIAEEKEEIFQVLHAAAHQVGEGRFHFRHRHGTGGNQILVPLLMTWQGYQGYPADTAIADQLVKQLGHRLFPT